MHNNYTLVRLRTMQKISIKVATLQLYSFEYSSKPQFKLFRELFLEALLTVK